MGLNSIDIVVLLLIAGTAIGGAMRGFVTEALSMVAWIGIVVMVKFFHAPLALVLTGLVGTAQGAAVLALALLGGGTYFVGRMIANAIGSRTRASILGPLDRAVGFGFGALKGLILASLGFLALVLVFDTVGGGPSQRPKWMTSARTYPLLNATSAALADMVDRRRRGEPMFGKRQGEVEEREGREGNSQ